MAAALTLLRRLAVLVLFLGSAIAAPEALLAQRQAGPAFTSTTVRLRSQPSKDAAVRAVIPIGAAVQVQACDSAWCRVQFRRLDGFVAAQFLAETAPSVTLSRGRGYVNSQGIWVPSPSRISDDKPPPGASAKCRDGTYSFSMSRRGTCSHHGGVQRWLP
jgi:uncharacterized protein YraI